MHDPPREAPLRDDERLFELLDRYVASLHAGDGTTRSGFLERHPELAGLLNCLDSLDRLAPAPYDGDLGSADTHVRRGGATPAEDGALPAVDAPSTFGKYELLEELGRGGMGVVFRARQTDLDRSVALKMILSSRLASAEDVRRFYAEARAAGSLRHPNIIGIHEVGQHQGQHYFAMDYVPGESLAQVLAQGPVDPETAARWVAEIARAVHHLHAHQIIHRDLKPSNILIDGQGCPYVTDFGLAKVFGGDSQTQTGTIVGTPSYMAPEQAAGRPSQISPRSDVYSLGAILYELLGGRPPFRRDNPLDTLVDVLEGEPTLLTRLNPRLPRPLELICFRCLEKDPGRRYDSAEALAEDLEHYLRGEPVDARPRGPAQALERWARREPALVSRLGGLLAASAIVQANYLVNGIDLAFHLRIMSLFAVWAAVSFLFQWMLHREWLADLGRFAWPAADVLLLTTLLLLAEGPIGTLLIGYPLLIAAAGLFFRVRLVLFTTVVSLVSYAALVALRTDPEQPHYPVIFAAVLAVLGFIVAFQVYRVRALSRYYERRWGC